MIQHVYQRYGTLGAAMTANVITYRGRSAARDIGKALAFEPQELEKLSSLVARWGWRDPSDTAEKQFHFNVSYDLSHPRIRKFLSLYVAAQNPSAAFGAAFRRHGDLPRAATTGLCRWKYGHHAGARGDRGEWDKEDCADLGLVESGSAGVGHDGGAGGNRSS